MIVGAIVSVLRPLPVPKYRLLNPWVAKSGTRVARVFGATMDLDLSDLIQRNIYLGCYERHETRWVRSHLSRGDTVVDVGANVGYYSALAAQIVGPSGRVICIEPSPRCFAKLDAMIRQNHLSQCRALNVGLSDVNGELTLYEPLPSRGNLNSTMMPQPDSTALRVPVRRLDDLIDELALSHIDLLKIDVEGHELSAFRGGERTLRSGRIRAILCEVNEWHLREHGTSGAAMLRFLQDCGFDVPRLADDNAANANYLIRRRP